MFTTEASAEVNLSQMHSCEEKHWLMVEHDLNVPWFHVALQKTPDVYSPRTFLVSNSDVLKSLVDTLEEHAVSYLVQIVIPAVAFGTSRWNMRQITKLERAKDRCGKNSEIYTFEHGETLLFSESDGWDAGDVKHLEVFFEQKLSLSS